MMILSRAWRIARNALGLAGIIGLAMTANAQAQGKKGPSGRGNFGKSLPASGLSATFPGGAACAPIASAYGDATRYDGSQRSTGGAEGAHGGIDLTLKEGTPLLAVAPGRVFSAGEGGILEGIFIWLLHMPEDTGLPFAFLSKYQHLVEPSQLTVGARVTVGQPIALSGKTGTVGGHYGQAGYPHLHLTVRVVAPEAASIVDTEDFRLLRDTAIVDPLVIYVPRLASPEDAAALPAAQKRLSVPYVNAQGKAIPEGAAQVWPVACP